jgi:PleD family two-component response regulator
MESLIEKMEIVNQTKKHDPRLNKKLNELDPSTKVESEPQCILVVDDDENLANTFKMILESAGYNVDIALTGLQALRARKNAS